MLHHGTTKNAGKKEKRCERSCQRGKANQSETYGRRDDEGMSTGNDGVAEAGETRAKRHLIMKCICAVLLSSVSFLLFHIAVSRHEHQLIEQEKEDESAEKRVACTHTRLVELVRFSERGREKGGAHAYAQLRTIRTYMSEREWERGGVLRAESPRDITEARQGQKESVS